MRRAYRLSTTICCALAVADAKMLGSTSFEEFDDGAYTVGAGAPLEFDAPELEVYDRLLDAPKARDGDDENFRLLSVTAQCSTSTVVCMS